MVHKILTICLLLTTAALGSAVFQDTDSDRLVITDAAILDVPDGDCAWAFWIKTDDWSGAGTQYIWDWQAGTPYSSMIGYEDSSGAPGKLRHACRDNDGTEPLTTTLGTVNNDVWRHIVLRRQTGSEVWEFYIDGTSNATETETNLDGIAVATNWTFGADVSAGPGNFFDGKLAEVAFWNANSLTDDDIDKLSGTGAYAGTAYSPNDIGTAPSWYLPLYDDKEADVGSLTTTNNGVVFDTADHPVAYSTDAPAYNNGYRRRTANETVMDLSDCADIINCLLCR